MFGFLFRAFLFAGIAIFFGFRFRNQLYYGNPADGIDADGNYMFNWSWPLPKAGGSDGSSSKLPQVARVDWTGGDRDLALAVFSGKLHVPLIISNSFVRTWPAMRRWPRPPADSPRHWLFGSAAGLRNISTRLGRPRFTYFDRRRPFANLTEYHWRAPSEQIFIAEEEEEGADEAAAAGGDEEGRRREQLRRRRYPWTVEDFWQMVEDEQSRLQRRAALKKSGDDAAAARLGDHRQRYFYSSVNVSEAWSDSGLLEDDAPFLERLLLPWHDGPSSASMFWIGSPGIITNRHFDVSENWFVQVHGRKQFLLSPPSSYDRLALYPESHPSGRQSQSRKGKIYALEAWLEPGDVLYVPAFWFHQVKAAAATASALLEPVMSLNSWTMSEPSMRYRRVTQVTLPFDPRWPRGVLVLAVKDYIARLLKRMHFNPPHEFVHEFLDESFESMRKEIIKEMEEGGGEANKLTPDQLSRVMIAESYHRFQCNGVDEFAGGGSGEQEEGEGAAAVGPREALQRYRRLVEEDEEQARRRDEALDEQSEWLAADLLLKERPEKVRNARDEAIVIAHSFFERVRNAELYMEAAGEKVQAGQEMRAIRVLQTRKFIENLLITVFGPESVYPFLKHCF